MYSTEFLNALLRHSPVVSEATEAGTVVEHFGDIDAELHALQNDAVVCPVAGFSRIQVAGRDRAKYLHNFCTNDVNALQKGQICEAFFTDVKAKVLAHGYVAAFGDVHEIWMLPGDEQSLLIHLNRYIISEDVTVTSLSDQGTTLVVMGPQTEAVLAQASISEQDLLESGYCCSASDATVVTCRWNHAPITFLSTVGASELWQRLLTAGATPAGAIIFHHQRILEGFPIVGIDITDSNLAPEADRNAEAISYKKGCYLGQEPIARLDAMGHVNRKLCRCHVTPVAGSDPDGLPQVTSRSMVANGECPALISLPVKLIRETPNILARCPDDAVVAVHITPTSQA